MLTIVLTRHGDTTRSDPEQHLGQRIDIGLSAEGRAAAAALADRLAGVAFDRIVSSPLRRARETALILAAGRVVEEEGRLAEMDYGAWEGLTYAQIEARDGPFRRRWEEDPATLACPDGESGDEVADRVRSFLADAAGDPEDGPILVVAHSTLNRILLCVTLGVAIRDFRRRFRQEPANLTVLRFAEAVTAGAQLIVVNDVSHVRGMRGATWDEAARG